jgi:uncharacterized repeat protein (TIGR01451 family)
MKPARFLTVVMILVLGSTMVYAAGTPAGTSITNQASGYYNDANGNVIADSGDPALSNIVTTVVSQVAGVTLTPLTAAQNLSANSFTTYAITLTNTGNGSDTFSLAAAISNSPSGTYTIEIYHDADGDQVLDAGETTTSSTGSLAYDGEYDLIIKVIEDDGTSASVAGDIIEVELTTTSTFNGTVSEVGTYTSTITAATIDVTVGSDPVIPEPGEVITYQVCLDNTGGETAYNAIFYGPIPANTSYVAGSIRVGTGGGTYATATPKTDIADADEADYNATSDTVTVVVGDVASGSEVCVYFQVQVDSPLPAGTEIVFDPEIVYENDQGDEYPSPDPGGSGTNITVEQIYAVDATTNNSAPVSYTGDPGDEILHSFTVTNNGNGEDDFSLGGSGTYLTWTFYQDVDGDGVIDAGIDLVITQILNLASGGTYDVIAVATIPAGTADDAVDNSTLTVTSLNDPAGTPASDSIALSTTTTAPSLSLVKSVSPTGNQPPGTTLTYTVVVSNTGDGEATTVVINDAIPTNTTYVANSLTVDSISKTDNDDADEATYTGTSVIFEFASLASGGSHTLTFQVTID